jgi:hypothetical protein
VKQKVVANHVFRTSELNDEAISRITKDIPKLIEK